MITRVTETKTEADLVDKKEAPAKVLAMKVGMPMHTLLKRFGWTSNKRLDLSQMYFLHEQPVLSSESALGNEWRMGTLLEEPGDRFGGPIDGPGHKHHRKNVRTWRRGAVANDMYA